MIKLYGYWRSSAAYRVRIALHLKKIPHENCPVHLIKNGGEQHLTDYRNLNPQQLVPLLVDGDFRLNQSLAILEYLEDIYPDPPLLPADIKRKAQVKAMCLMIVADIHPLNNLRVLQYLESEWGHLEEEKKTWYHHWIKEGFSALEQQLTTYSPGGPFCFGESLTLADLCLIPQVYNAYRYHCPVDDFPKIKAIYNHCQSLDAFIQAVPELQADAS